MRVMRVMTRALTALALLVSLAGEARGQYVTEHCDQAQIQVLTSAISSAEFLLDNATKYLGRGGVNAEPRPFLLYFGDLRNIAVVAAKIAAMNLELLVTTYNCADDGLCVKLPQPPFSWADAQQGAIHFCSQYWLAPAVSVDPWSGIDQRSLVVHELSHLPPAPITINYAGMSWSGPLDLQWAAQVQAVAMPTYAEAYQYFAWHLPIWQPPRQLDCSLSTRPASSSAAGAMVVGLFAAALTYLQRRRSNMRRTVIIVVALGLIGIGAVAVRRGVAKDHRPLPLRLTPVAELPSVPLRCEVEAPARVQLGAPLPVTVRVTNTGAEPLSFWALGTAWTPNWHPFDVTHDDAEHVPARWDHISITMGPPQARGYIKVGAGETVHSTVSVTDQWTLRPGVFTITQHHLADTFTGEFDPQRAMMHSQPARLDCPVVRVEVAPASD